MLRWIPLSLSLLFLVACSDFGEPEILDPILLMDQTHLDFGEVTVGSALSRILLIENPGEADLVLDLELGAGSGGFSFSGSQHLEIPPGERREISILFAPVSEATYKDSALIHSNDPERSDIWIPLQGRGTALPVPGIQTTPASLDFGTVVLGDTSALQLVIQSSGTDTLRISSLSSSDPVFQLSSLAVDLPPDSGLQIEILYIPQNAGTSTASLSIHSNTPDSPLELALAGTGVAPVSYSTDVQPIFNANCITCHGGSGGLFLTSYANLMAGTSAHGPVITPGDGEGSRLIQRLRGQAGGLMPQGGPALPESSISTIRDWIDQGAEDN